nr:hypothetical protein [Tanacetum cinerariifolium]
VRQARLVDTESELEEAPSESLGSRVPIMGEEFEAVKPSGTRTDLSHSSGLSDSTTPLSPDHPLTLISPTHASFYRKTTRMTVCVQPAMSPGHSAKVTEAMALSDLAFRKRYRSSYESPSSSSLILPVRKRYQGTSELILDTDSDGGELEDDDIKDDESLDVDDEGERSDDEGHGLDDKGHGLGDEDHRLDEEGHGLEGKRLGLKEEEAAPEVYRGRGAVKALREHTSGPQRLVALPPTFISDIDRDLRELYNRLGVVRDKIFSHRYMFMSLEREQERTAVTFGALWRLVLALEAWPGHVDIRMTDTS